MFTHLSESKVVSNKFTPGLIKYIEENTLDFLKSNKRHWWRYDSQNSVFSLEDIIGKQDPNLDLLSIAISKKLDRFVPVFIIENCERLSTSRRTYDWRYEYEINVDVHLDSLGFACMRSAEQAYQEIETYIVNVLRVNPDKAVPVQVADKDKINQHGFDLKQSFRHRK
jgi:hypothetical protein